MSENLKTELLKISLEKFTKIMRFMQVSGKITISEMNEINLDLAPLMALIENTLDKEAEEPTQLKTKTMIPRPTWNDEMRNELAEIIGNRIFDWSNESHELSECIESANKVFEWHSSDNGYELAKEFEDKGFSPDIALVELLDSAGYEKHLIQKKYIKKWVEDNSLKLDLAVGQMVKAKFIRSGEKACEIMKLYPETMQYGLWYEELGREKQKGHVIVDAEKILEVL